MFLSSSSGPLKARVVELISPASAVPMSQDRIANQTDRRSETIRRSRLTSIATSALPDRRNAEPGRSAPSVRLDLFDDVSVVAVHDRFDRNPRGVTWVGHVQSEPGSSVTLVYSDGLLTASIAVAGARYTIRPAPEATRRATPVAGGALHIVAEMDQAQYPREREPLQVTIPETVRRQADVRFASDTADLIDLLVVWTPSAAMQAGGATAIQDLITVGVSETNTSYANSGVDQRIRLVHMEGVSYTESGDHGVDLTRLTDGSGSLNGVAAVRDAYSADLVMMVVGSTGGNDCGVSWVMTTPSTAFAANAFSVVVGDCITPNYTFAHELGHLMGLRHDWFVEYGPDPVKPFSYAHGHVNVGGTPSTNWRTVMSYNDRCAAQAVNCTRVLYWSNPDVLLNGAPMGIPPNTAFTNPPCGPGQMGSNGCDAFDALVLNQTASYVANFRQAGSPPPGAFSKVAPVSQTSGVGASVTLSWQAAPGATSYEYCLDTIDDNVCAGFWVPVGLALSVQVNNLAPASSYSWQVRALNANGTTSANVATWWGFTTIGYAGAIYDAGLQAPKCGILTNNCDTGPTLILGADTMAGGPEPNQPNTIHDSCTDGTLGVFHDDESIDRLRVFTLDGQPFAPGKTVTVEIRAWIFNSTRNKIDLYYAADANAPSWTHVTTLTPAADGAQTFSTNYVLPNGPLQAIRAHIRDLGSASPCEMLNPTGYDDYDDLAFVVTPDVGTGVAGDFNFDGFPDLLLHGPGGALKFWFMNGRVQQSERAPTPSTMDPVWQAVALEDLNGDRKTDIVWQHTTTGQVDVWFMNGTVKTGSAYLSAGETVWKLSAMGDLDGDGKADLIWTSPYGDRYAVLLDGLAVRGAGLLPTVPVAWRIVGMGDLNQDGREDLIWQKSDGNLAYWLMSGLTLYYSGALTPSATAVAWKLSAAANFDKAGGVDLVFHNINSNLLYMWHMTGTALSGEGFLSPNQLEPGWKIVGSR
jgi:hypothetical protein